MDNSETLVIVAALFAVLALGGPRAEAIQKHADSRYLRLQAASPQRHLASWQSLTRRRR